MTSLAIAALLFVGIHVFVSGTTLRDALVARLGERPYLGMFSLLSAGVLAWLIWAFVAQRVPTITPLLAWRWLAAILVLFAFLLIVIGVTTRGATGVGGEGLLLQADPARGIHRITRHPFLVGMALWSGTHLAFNPEPATAWFFGSFLALSLIGPRLIDAKRARKQGEAWTRYAAVTSTVPFVAIAQGRNRLAPGEIRLWQLAVAAVSYALVVALHARMFGVPPA